MSTSSNLLVSNKFAVLAEADPAEAQDIEETKTRAKRTMPESESNQDHDPEVSFKTPSIEDTIVNAMKHINQSADESTKKIVESVVAAVVAAFMPVVATMQATIAELKAPKPQASAEIPSVAAKAIRSNHFKWDEVEQYSRRDNIIIKGVAESDGECTNDIVIDLAAKAGVTITHQDISTSHRLKNRRRNQPASIVAKFTRRDIRNEIMRKKKNLRRQPDCNEIFLDEHLTSLRHKMLMAVKKDSEVEKAWTIDGKIICLMALGTNRKLVVNTPEDLHDKLGWSQERIKSELSLDI